MTFANPWPWWVLVPALVAAAGLAYRAYAPRLPTLSRRRQRVLVGLRLLSLVLLIVFLMRPVRVLPASGPRQALVPVLVDASRSMRVADLDGRRRIDVARELLTDDLLPALGEEFTVTLQAFGDEVVAVEPDALDASGSRSDVLGALDAVREQYRGQELAGIVVVTDGGDTGTGDLARHPLAGDVPVFAVGMGAPRVEKDREVLSVTAGRAVLRDTVVPLGVSVVSHGFGDEAFDVRVLENGQPVQVRRVQPSEDGSPVREVFQVSPSADAATLYTVEIPVASGELVEQNNARGLLVQPPGRPRRLLVLQGAPGYDHAFLMRALRADAGLEADAIVRKGQNDRGEDTFYVQASPDRAVALGSGFPDSRRALFGYDTVVFANVPAGLMSGDELELIEQFVAERGGGLLVMGAESFGRPGFLGSPVEAVLPLELEDRWNGEPPADAGRSREPNHVILTSEGARHPIMQIAGAESPAKWLSLPPLGGSTALGGPRAGASVLALTLGPGGGYQPLVAVQRYGRGRSLIFTGEASWRWRMLTPLEDTSYERFWQQAARWLATSAPSPVSVTLNGGETPGSMVSVDVVVRDEEFRPASDASVTMSVSGPGMDQVERRAELVDANEGIYRVAFRADVAGVYRATPVVRRAGTALEASDAWLLVGGADRELTDPRRNDEFLRRLTAVSGGQLVGVDAVPRLTELLRAGVAGAAPTAYRDIWHSGWTFALILGLLCSEWVVRRQAGLR